MDSALIGVLIGSLSSILGTIVVNWFSLYKEKQQWLRQQEAEAKKQERDEQKAREEQLRDTYHNCLRCLSALVAAKQEKIKITDEEHTKLVQEAYKWLNLLALTHQNKSTRRRINFEVSLSTFREAPEYADKMLEDVEAIVKDDTVLFPKETNEHTAVIRPGERSILISIDKEFRRSQFAQGIELSESHRFTYNISQMTPGQRQKFWDMYFERHRAIPLNVGLKIPTYDSKEKKIVFREYWQAQVNPFTTKSEQILKEWEAAYEQAWNKAQGEQPSNKAT
ncbi:MAG: hypothetical protein ACJ74J_10020 [Blastocatellia bacterium]